MTRIDSFLSTLTLRGAAVLLILLTLAATLPGFTTLPPVDRDEARFVQTSRQMVASGDVIDLRFQEGTRYKKPVGIYWLQAVAVAATGGGEAAIWRYRLPSLVAALVAVLMTARIGAVFGGARAGLIAGGLMAGVFILGAEARLAKTDAVILACICVAQGVLARLWRDRGALGPDALGWGEVLAFWGALAVGVLVKGPIAPMVVGLCALALALVARRGRWLLALRPLSGVAILMALVLPWYVAITLKAGSAFWDEALGRDLLGKVAEGQESHGAPPGSYLAALWVTFFPASVALALALPAIWRARAAPGVVFALCWAVPGWVVFEAVATKLLHYTLPFYPALALAVALVWEGVARGPVAVWAASLASLVAAVAVLLLLGLGAASQGMALPAPLMPFGLGLAVLVVALALFARALRRGQALLAVVMLALAGAGLQAGAFRGLAAAPALWPAPAVVALAVDGGCPAPALWVEGYGEASLVFLSPGPVRFVDRGAALAALAGGGCVRAVVSGEAEAGGLRGRVRGINLGTGKGIDLWVYGP
ncbi:MAG: ArnT family glycosyltransferase [Gemmobacter sp.]